ncbi:MAG: LptF/LptG family permease [Armatimonadota bacterium]|nr:LptF/LptG family permease [Armatimonadota bacterium]MDR7549412.1 LptF/LptG family permease [Armatimonadota bacterium]
MRQIDRYILREVGGIFVFGAAVFTTLLMVNHLFFLARLAAEAGIPIRTSLLLLVLRVPYMAAYGLPMAMLLATLMAFGRLSDRNEIIALRTSGWSLGRIALPVLVAGAVVTAISLAVTEYVVPPSETRYRDLLAEVLRSPTRQVQEHVLFREPIDGVESVFYARALDTRDSTMSGVVITQFQHDRPVRLIEAARARFGTEGWVLQDGTIYLLGSGGGVTTRFASMRVALQRTPRQAAAPRRDPSEMTIGELRQQIAALQAAGENILRYVLSLHLKVALPASSVIFALLAVPLGLRPHRSGRSAGLALTVLVLLGYYLMMSVTLTLGERGQLAPFWAAWMPNLTVAAAGGYLLWTSR